MGPDVSYAFDLAFEERTVGRNGTMKVIFSAVLKGQPSGKVFYRYNVK